jgi:pyruvate/2-oxoglutarate/acetoin dehydrogenase E1 component
MSNTTYRDAVRASIREALQKDERVFLMGEDVGRYGGCYAVSKGLLESSARTAFATRRCRRRPSRVPASARQWAACGRSSRS